MDERWQKLVEELNSSGYLKTPRIIEAFKAVDRKDFVSPEYKDKPYGNYPLPIGEGQTISQPLTVAFMLELLDPRLGEKVLDIGSGSGWVTALLAELVGLSGRVVGVERIQKLCEFGKNNLKKYFSEDRARIFCEDATSVVPAEGSFDKIIAGATASKDIPTLWRDALKVGGKIVAPIGGSIWRFTKVSDAEWKEEEFPGFSFVPLVANHKNISKESSGSIVQTIEPGGKILQKAAKGCYRLPIILFVISLFFSFITYVTLAPVTLKARKVEIEIPEGAGIRQIAGLLKKNGLVRSEWLFIVWVEMSGKAGMLQYGRYQFEKGATIPEITSRLQSGERFANEVTITIPEGWNLQDIAGYFETQEIVSKDAFFGVVGSPREFREANSLPGRMVDRFLFLGDRPAGANLEGYLFPDTYRIFRSTSAEEIVVKMLENFDKKITPELRGEIMRQKKTLYEILTIASLIEKEVVSDEDRALVSGILWKRLGLGIGLQVDATVSYVTGKRSVKVSLEELAIDSLYNTYKYRGLPPGPIANPGLSAVRAAIFPKPSSYLYYLSAPDGRTIFSKTLEEHNGAKTKFLK